MANASRMANNGQSILLGNSSIMRNMPGSTPLMQKSALKKKQFETRNAMTESSIDNISVSESDRLNMRNLNMSQQQASPTANEHKSVTYLRNWIANQASSPVFTTKN